MKHLYSKIFGAVAAFAMSGTISAQYSNGLIVTNEGNFSSPTAEISYIEGNTITNNIYSTVNGEQLGDILQSLYFNGDKAMLVVNNSNKIVVVNRSSFVKQATITNHINQPRYTTVANGKIFTTNTGYNQPSYVSVHDVTTLAWIQDIPMSQSSEEIHTVAGKVYVMKAWFGNGNTIEVIDPSTNTIVQSITLEDGLQSIRTAGNFAYALTSNSTGTTLYKIDAATNTIVGQIKNSSITDAGKLALDDSNAYIKSGLNVYQIPLSMSTFPTTPLFTGQGTDSFGSGFYGFNVIDNKIYQINANDYTDPSSVHRYSVNGAFETTFTAGMLGNGIYKNVYTTLATTETVKNNFSIYPNPTSDILYIKSDNRVSYQIYDLTGRMVKSGNYTNGIDVKNLSKGMYILKTVSGSKSEVQKFLVK